MAAVKLSAKEVAKELGTDARTLRKFFRSDKSPVEAVGQGNRYEVTKGDLKKVKKAFDAWSKPKKAPAESIKVTTGDLDEIIDDIDIDEETTPEDVMNEVDLEVEDPDEFEEPTDDELEEIEIDI